MPAPLPQDTREAVKKRLEDGVRTREIAAEFNFSISKACGMKKLWKETGEVWHAPTGTSGRPHVISDEYRERLREYLDRNPDALMRDIADFLNDECGIDVTVSTVWRTMVRLGWKENRPRAKERDALGQWKPTLPRDERGKPIYGPAKDRGKVKVPKKKKPTPQEALLNRVQIFVQDYMSQPRFDASHDYSHVLRVVNLSRHILRVELVENPHTRYDQMAVELAALVHDVNDHKYALPAGEQLAPRAPMQPTPVQPTPVQPTPVQPTPVQLTPVQPVQRLINPSSTPKTTSLALFSDTPSHPPYGHVPPQTPNQGNSIANSDPPDQQPHPDVDPSLQALSNNSTTLPQLPQNNHTTPSQPYTPLPPTPQTAQIQDQNALQPLSSSAQPKDVPRPHRTIEQHLLRLRAPAPLAAAVGQICSAISYSYETENPEQVASILSEHPELAIVQDADRLDALGAIGVGRAFGFGGVKGRKLEDSIEHMDEKLARLEGIMKTSEGRRLARARSERVSVFRSWWEEEASFGMGFGATDGEMRNGSDGVGGETMDVSMNGGGGGNGGSGGPHDGWPGTAGPSSQVGQLNGYGNPNHGPGPGNGVSHGYGESLRQSQTQTPGQQDHPDRQLMMEAGML